MKWQNLGKNLAFVVAVAALTIGGWALFGPRPHQVKLSGQTAAVQKLELTAVGDSLTHGVGDDTNAGGYVALIKSDLQATGNYAVTTQNFGVSGDTSTQIQKRIDTQKKLQQGIADADVLTVTVGGNDLMHVLQAHLLDMNAKNVAKGSVAFQKHLTKLITTMRGLNKSAPIYVFGIYNPFYVYFPKLTAMTDAVTTWNKATQQTLAKLDGTYYVDIDSVLTKGGTTASKAAKSSVKAALSDSANPLIFTQDHFHPNNAGYAKMTSQLWAKMQATKKRWAK
ncbi:SGNH/GDSL hydrolase family protein [Lacticaseibacillus kribbianus]|uniref:SGNH/GDSL hydrolase family protein n=1 Tax=Lacticaseibacillus kribbianus TaxID=2926292 RepID=UPI003B84AA7E